MFFDHRAKTDKNIIVEDSIRVSTGESTAVVLNTSMITKILHDIRKHPDKKNLFGYLATISGLRGVFSCMKDFMQQDAQFERFVKGLLGEKFPAFQKIIFFCRNVLSHHVTADIILTREDYEKQMLMLQQTYRLDFAMSYKEIFGAVWKGKESYGFSIAIDTKRIREGQKYTDIIGWHEQLMLAEFCYNLSEYFKAMKIKLAKAKASSVEKSKKTPVKKRIYHRSRK